MTQKEHVVEAMQRNGGYATLQQLYQLIDFSTWGTKTPQASVRQIVQINKEFFRIEAGLWGLSDCKQKILQKFNIVESDKKSVETFTHSYIQGVISEIGNIKNFNTYIPPQDKNRMFLEKKLSDVATVQNIFEFTYPQILRYARTIDVIWFNNRNLPNAFYEVEHTTDIKNSLNKFYELQDYRARFFIVAPKEREKQFIDVISSSIYREIRDIVSFKSYDTLIKQYEKEIIAIDGAI